MRPMMERCVFCGSPVGADDERTGRGAAAAHAACADRALTDDAHWDAIAEAEGDASSPATPARNAWLAIVALVLVIAVVVAAAVGFSQI